jgi:hypothetical protein
MVATKGTRSRRKTVPTKTLTLDGEVVKQNYCRRCQRILKPIDFYDATDTMLDRNGKMSVCKECIDDLFTKIFSTNTDVSKTILQLCRILNVAFIPAAIQSTIDHASKMFDKNGNLAPMFGYYKSKMSSIATLNQTGMLTFTEPGNIPSDNPMSDDDIENSRDVKQFWGDGLSLDDYQWLETEFSAWQTHKTDTRGGLTLIKLAVLKLFDIRKARAEGRDTTALEKSLRDTLGSAALTPATENIANSGKSDEAFGVWLADIENTTPAEWVKDKSIYKDVDNAQEYGNYHITRPILNFWNQSHDLVNDALKDETDQEEKDNLEAEN